MSHSVSSLVSEHFFELFPVGNRCNRRTNACNVLAYTGNLRSFALNATCESGSVLQLQACRETQLRRLDLHRLDLLLRVALREERLDLGLMHHRDLIGCSPPTTLKMPRVKLREQSAGLYLRASQLSVARQLGHD